MPVVVVIAVRLPDLGQPEHHDEQRARASTAAAADERHERDQPDEVLRREDLRERDVRGHRRGAGRDELLAGAAAPRIERIHDKQHDDCRNGRQRGRKMRPGPDEIVGAGALDDM